MNKKKRFIKKLEGHEEKTLANLKYSLDRFDILIISISSGGLVFSMGFVKDIILKTPSTNFLLLKLTWILFGLAIVLNLLSQVTGYYANSYELRITKNIIRHERNRVMAGNQTSNECKKKIMNFFTNMFNGSSLIILIAALVFFVIFLSETF